MNRKEYQKEYYEKNKERIVARKKLKYKQSKQLKMICQIACNETHDSVEDSLVEIEKILMEEKWHIKTK